MTWTCLPSCADAPDYQSNPMEAKTLQTVIAQVHRRFPDFAGVQPKVQLQSAGGLPQAKSGPTYLLSFHSTRRTAGGAQSKAISRWVRVVVNDAGKIIKITTSR